LLRLELEPSYPSLKNPFGDQRQAVGIRVEKVHFAYKAGHNVLNGISLEIQPSEKVALVGASGGGKSTLVQTLLGLYPTVSGTISYGGVPITEIGLNVVREHVAAVLQHPSIFNDTIRANLTLGRELSDAELWEALEVAQLRKSVEKLAQGLDTVLGRQGVRFSGGQRQRLAIARMVLTKPAVVIMDEATSAIDAETEQRLYTSLNEFLENRTTLVIAHRLSAVKQVDRAYVFEDGKICEQGSHAELLRQGGLYAELYGERQA
jgi:ATP-binding cassette subfamily C protein